LSDERPSDVLGALPHRRPHRRSDKRVSPATAPRARAARKKPAPRREPTAARREAPATRRASDDRPERLRQPAQPAGAPPAPPRSGPPESSTGRDILGIAAQATAELAEIGLSVSARVLRNAVGRLPRP
jgi:hypothetical protein